MDLREAKLILEKINRLFDSMSLDERKIDSFEQDLMLSYTKQFYDSFSYEKDNPVPQPIKRKAPPKIVVEQSAPIVTPPPPQPIVVKKDPVPEKVEIVQPKMEPAVVAPNPAPVAPAAAVASAPTPPPAPVIVKKTAPKLAPNIEALFSTEDANELSHKLSQQPIADLTKAIGINERILTINELFDKDTVFFTEIMKKINNLSSFDDAKKILVQLAQKFDWVAEDKKKKATIFIKLVRRRFL